MPKKISVLGSTGSIGRSTLSVVRESSTRLEVFGLAAGRNSALLHDQIVEFSPRVVSCSRKEDASLLRAKFPSLEIFDGIDGAAAIAGRAEADIVVSAITGINGLRPTLAALRAGKR
ncbi:MAG: 1-deoxy-D-xylulose-5-phosphate reductoisomerase, partial [Candidatus Aminicenantes bacterium]|nr:1-deoxy-D-xylulose-5-phosphate reductoisomerase [Candidatus Aminicenantes bacterium]